MSLSLYFASTYNRLHTWLVRHHLKCKNVPTGIDKYLYKTVQPGPGSLKQMNRMDLLLTERMCLWLPAHSVTKRRFKGTKKKSPEMCFFLVPEGICRIDMTKKRGNHS